MYVQMLFHLALSPRLLSATISWPTSQLLGVCAATSLGFRPGGLHQQGPLLLGQNCTYGLRAIMYMPRIGGLDNWWEPVSAVPLPDWLLATPGWRETSSRVCLAMEREAWTGLRTDWRQCIVIRDLQNIQVQVYPFFLLIPTTVYYLLCIASLLTCLLSKE